MIIEGDERAPFEGIPPREIVKGFRFQITAKWAETVEARGAKARVREMVKGST